MASLLALDPAKLQNIAGGWLPPQIDLGQWREIRVIATTDDGIAVNCYVVWDEISREAALFDTGWDAQPIFDLIAAESVDLKHLFLTHTDPDHVGAMAAVRERFPKLHLHTNSKNVPPQHRNRANDFIHLGSLRITLLFLFPPRISVTPAGSSAGVTHTTTPFVTTGSRVSRSMRLVSLTVSSSCCQQPSHAVQRASTRLPVVGCCATAGTIEPASNSNAIR